MNATKGTNVTARWVVIVALAFTTLLTATGCDELTGLTGLAGIGGIPGLDSEWFDFDFGTENVWTWGGLADPWATSSLGLPEMPGYYFSQW